MPDFAARGTLSRLRSRLVRWGGVVIRSDYIRITVIVVSMTLSAFSVYQATRASDDAEQLLDDARILHMEATRQAGYLQTLMDHDMAIMRSMCEATVQRGLARVSYLDKDPDVARLVTANLTLDALKPLLLGDREATCAVADLSQPSYLIERARQRLDYFDSGTLSEHSSASAFQLQADGLGVRERFLMAAGLLFALAVALTIAVDQLGAGRERPLRIHDDAARRWQYRILGVDVVLFAVGLGFLIVTHIDLLFTLAVLGGLAVAVALLWLRARRGFQRQPEPRKRGRSQWWAEVVGAFTLVVFTATALGFSFVTIQERESSARADRQAAIALDLQHVGEEQALRDLSAMSYIAGLDVREVTERQVVARTSGPEADAAKADEVGALADVFDQRMLGAEDALRNQTHRDLLRAAAGDCSVPPAAEVQPSAQVFEESVQDADTLMWDVIAQQQPSQSCAIVSSISRYEARIWGSLASTLTVGLVVLGLSGFLLALGSSSERSARSSRALLIIGAGGTVVGMVLGIAATPALVGGANVPSNAATQEFADHVAAGMGDPCGSRERLDAAIETFDAYGPAFDARAYSANCTAAVYVTPALSSELDPSVLPSLLDDLRRAKQLGPVTPLLDGSLGWFEILDGIENDDPSMLRSGLRDTEAALIAIAADPSWKSSFVHVLRFNRALALAALDQRESALAAYEDTVRCMDPRTGCPGGGYIDRDLRDNAVFGALADLELIADARDVDAYRFAVLGLPYRSSADPFLNDVGLDVFPQEMQVVTDDDAPPASVTVVWYVRTADARSWAVLPDISAATIRKGDYLGVPVSARALLPTGQYRADVYASGQRIEAFAEHTAEDGSARYSSQRSGLSAVVPADWLEWRDDGVEWHLGPDESTGLTLRRVEGMNPFGEDIEDYLTTQLVDWSGVPESELAFESNGWLLGLSDVVVATHGDSDLLAAGFGSYASHQGCGGTLFLARVSTDSTSSTDEVFDSIVLDRKIDTLPDPKGAVGAEGVSVSIPLYWDAVSRPEGGTGSLISAKDCGGAANLLVGREAYTGTIAAYTDSLLHHYTSHPAEFPQFSLASRTSLDVPGAEEAELIEYTWLPADKVDPVRQWQVLIRGADEQVTYATLTIFVVDEEFYRPDVDLILGSFSME